MDGALAHNKWNAYHSIGILRLDRPMSVCMAYESHDDTILRVACMTRGFVADWVFLGVNRRELDSTVFRRAMA